MPKLQGPPGTVSHRNRTIYRTGLPHSDKTNGLNLVMLSINLKEIEPPQEYDVSVGATVTWRIRIDCGNVLFAEKMNL